MGKPIKAVIWDNGMMIVFDEQGQQVPEYQGEAAKKLGKLLQDHPDCMVRGQTWERSGYR